MIFVPDGTLLHNGGTTRDHQSLGLTASVNEGNTTNHLVAEVRHGADHFDPRLANSIVGILFIWGGLSGESVDRITGTGAGLALIGVVLLIWGIASLSSNDPA
jgi:hypothetical protein